MIIGLEAFGAAKVPHLSINAERKAQRFGDFSSDAFLNGEHVIKLAVIGLRPELGAAATLMS